MHWLYNIAIRAYLLSIRFSSYFNPKARKWIEGRRDVFDKLNQIPDDNRPLAWFHCASLGEFEQGRPVIEAFRTHYPHYRILLTFFSPSGYEIRKNYKQADVVCYLPADTPGNASRFVERINASLVVFVKYEYWHNFIHQITRRQMPFYVLSANFRNDQYFFRWWGKWFLKNMKKTTHFFVQHQDSALLLQHHNIKHVTITGDTRLDRVMAIANEEISLPIIEKFVAGHKVLVAGSTWPPDEKLLARLIMEVSQPIKLIIAPHEINESHLGNLESIFKDKAIRYSAATIPCEDKRVLIIDSIGKLSKIYRFGQFAYVGGGFGAGIHNVSEAAVYGVPVIFGPNFHKFREAHDLIGLGGAFSINDFTGLLEVFDRLCSDLVTWQHSADACRYYLLQHAGATEKVMKVLESGIEGGKH